MEDFLQIFVYFLQYQVWIKSNPYSETSVTPNLTQLKPKFYPSKTQMKNALKFLVYVLFSVYFQFLGERVTLFVN